MHMQYSVIYMLHRGCLKFVLIASTVTIIAACLLIGAALYAQVVFLTTPSRDQDIPPPEFADYQDITVISDDGLSISGWYIPGNRPYGVVLVHGVHANREYLLPQAQFLSEAGYHLLLIDLRGHGQSEGELITYGYAEAEDVKAAVTYLLEQPEIEHVTALGHSLGAAAVVRAAAEDNRIEAMVIQSSFSSLSQAVEDSFEFYSVLPRWPFAPIIIKMAEYRTGVEIGQVSSERDLSEMKPRPLLIIHSSDDNVFPIDHARTMYEAASGVKDIWIIEGLPHINPIAGHEEEYEQRVLNFFEREFVN